MRYTLQNLAQDIDRKLTSGSVDQSRDFYGAIDEGRRRMMIKISPPELQRTVSIEEALYDKVNRYAVPDDLNYDNVIDLKLQSSSRNVDTLRHPLQQVYSRRFSQKRGGARNVFNIDWDNGGKFINIYRPSGTRDMRTVQEETSTTGNSNRDQGTFKLIHDCDSLTTNGTWNVGGNIVDLKEDRLNYVSGQGSFSFDINNSGTSGFLENFTLAEFSLEDYFASGSVFSWFSFGKAVDQDGLPAVSSIKITLGSNTTDLLTDQYQFAVSQAHDSTTIGSGWNSMRFPLRDMISVGNPNPLALKYIRFDVTTTGATIPNNNMDAAIARAGNKYILTFNSAYFIIDAVSGAWKQKGTQLQDKLPFEEDSYQIYMLECAKTIQQELSSNNIAAKSDVTGIDAELKELYEIYSIKHPSEEVLATETSHIFGNYLTGYHDDPLGGSNSVAEF